MMGFTAMQAYEILKGNARDPRQLVDDLTSAVGFSNVDRTVRSNLDYSSLAQRLSGTPDGHSGRSIRFEESLYHGWRDQGQRVSASLVGTLATTGATLGTLAIGSTALMRAAGSASAAVTGGVAEAASRAIASRGMGAAVSLLNTPATALARFAPGLFGGAPAALSTLAGAIPTAASGVGKLAGIFGTMAGHALPLMAVGKAVSWAGKSMVENLATQRQAEDWMHETGYKYTFAGGASNVALGKGMNVEEQADIARFARDILGKKEWMRQSDFSEIFRGIQESELDFHVASAAEFKTKFEKVTEVLGDIARTFETTLEGAVHFLGQMQRSGFYSTTDQAAALFRTTGLAKASGKTAEEMMATGLTGAEMARSLGFSRSVGSELATGLTYRFANAFQYMNTYKESNDYLTQLQEVGGAEQAALAFTEMTLKRVKEDDFLQLILFGLFNEDGEVDGSRMKAFNRGELSFGELADYGKLGSKEDFERFYSKLDIYLSKLSGEEITKVMKAYITSTANVAEFDSAATALLHFFGMDDQFLASVFASMLNIESRITPEIRIREREVQQLQVGEQARERTPAGMWERYVKNPLAQLGQALDLSGIAQNINQFVETFMNRHILRIEKIDIKREELSLEAAFNRQAILNEAGLEAKKLPTREIINVIREDMQQQALLFGVEFNVTDSRSLSYGRSVVENAENLLGFDAILQETINEASGVNNSARRRATDAVSKALEDLENLGYGKEASAVIEAGKMFLENPTVANYIRFNEAADEFEAGVTAVDVLGLPTLTNLVEGIYDVEGNYIEGTLERMENNPLAALVLDEIKLLESKFEEAKAISERDGVGSVEVEKLEKTLEAAKNEPLSEEIRQAFDKVLAEFNEVAGVSISTQTEGKNFGLIQDLESMLQTMEEKEISLLGSDEEEAAREMRAFIDELKELIKTLREAKSGSKEFAESVDRIAEIRKSVETATGEISLPVLDFYRESTEARQLYETKHKELTIITAAGLTAVPETVAALEELGTALDNKDAKGVEIAMDRLRGMTLLTAGSVARKMIQLKAEGKEQAVIDAYGKLIEDLIGPGINYEDLIDSETPVDLSTIGLSEENQRKLVAATENPVRSEFMIEVEKNLALARAVSSGLSSVNEDEVVPLSLNSIEKIADEFHITGEARAQLSEIWSNKDKRERLTRAIKRNKLSDLFIEDDFKGYSALYGTFMGSGQTNVPIVRAEDGRALTKEQFLEYHAAFSMLEEEADKIQAMYLAPEALDHFETVLREAKAGNKEGKADDIVATMERWFDNFKENPRNKKPYEEFNKQIGLYNKKMGTDLKEYRGIFGATSSGIKQVLGQSNYGGMVQVVLDFFNSFRGTNAQTNVLRSLMQSAVSGFKKIEDLKTSLKDGFHLDEVLGSLKETFDPAEIFGVVMAAFEDPIVAFANLGLISEEQALRLKETGIKENILKKQEEVKAAINWPEVVEKINNAVNQSELIQTVVDAFKNPMATLVDLKLISEEQAAVLKENNFIKLFEGDTLESLKEKIFELRGGTNRGLNPEDFLQRINNATSQSELIQTVFDSFRDPMAALVELKLLSENQVTILKRADFTKLFEDDILDVLKFTFLGVKDKVKEGITETEFVQRINNAASQAELIQMVFETLEDPVGALVDLKLVSGQTTALRGIDFAKFFGGDSLGFLKGKVLEKRNEIKAAINWSEVEEKINAVTSQSELVKTVFDVFNDPLAVFFDLGLITKEQAEAFRKVDITQLFGGITFESLKEKALGTLRGVKAGISRDETVQKIKDATNLGEIIQAAFDALENPLEYLDELGLSDIFSDSLGENRGGLIFEYNPILRILDLASQDDQHGFGRQSPEAWEIFEAYAEFMYSEFETELRGSSISEKDAKEIFLTAPDPFASLQRMDPKLDANSMRKKYKESAESAVWDFLISQGILTTEAQQAAYAKVDNGSTRRELEKVFDQISTTSNQVDPKKLLNATEALARKDEEIAMLLTNKDYFGGYDENIKGVLADFFGSPATFGSNWVDQERSRFYLLKLKEIEEAKNPKAREKAVKELEDWLTIPGIRKSLSKAHGPGAPLSNLANSLHVMGVDTQEIEKIMKTVGEAQHATTYVFEGFDRRVVISKMDTNFARETLSNIFNELTLDEALFESEDFIASLVGVYDATEEKDLERRKSLLDIARINFELFIGNANLTEPKKENAKKFFNKVMGWATQENPDGEIKEKFKDALQFAKIVNTVNTEEKLVAAVESGLRHTKYVIETFLEDDIWWSYNYSQEQADALKEASEGLRGFGRSKIQHVGADEVVEYSSRFFNEAILGFYENYNPAAANFVDAGIKLLNLLDTRAFDELSYEDALDLIRVAFDYKIGDPEFDKLVAGNFWDEGALLESIPLILNTLLHGATVTPGMQALALELEEATYKKKILQYLLKNMETNEKLEATLVRLIEQLDVTKNEK